MDLGERESGEGTGRSRGRENYSWDVFMKEEYILKSKAQKRLFKKISYEVKKEFIG